MDQVAGVAQGVSDRHRCRSLSVPDHAVDDVEGEDVKELAPPAQPPWAGRARLGVRAGAGGARLDLGHETTRTGRAPNANAGAPRRLAVSFVPYTPSPRAVACPDGTPR